MKRPSHRVTSWIHESSQTVTVPSCFSFSIRLTGVVLAAMLLLDACGKDAANDAKAAQQAVDPSLMVARPTLVQRLKVTPVGKQPIAKRPHVPGQIAFDEQRVAHIGTTVTERVTELVTTPGQNVKAGDTLAQLYSTELDAAQLAYQKAAAQRDLQARTLERTRLLLAVDVIGSAELQRRRSELATAGTEVRAAVDQLRMMGVSPGALAKMRTSGMSSISPMVASIGGTVVERKVTRGQVTQPADELFTVVDLSHVWVVGEVPEDVAAGVQVGQAVEVDTGAGDRIVGKLIWVSDIVDPQTQTATVCTEVDSAERTLKPSMLAALLVQSQPEKRVVVPTSAMVRGDSRDYVFVHTSETNYQLTLIKLSDELNGVRPVISGVQADQPIVVEDNFHLNNEHKHAEMEGA